MSSEPLTAGRSQNRDREPAPSRPAAGETENPKRAAIVAAAQRLFLDAGFGATSMDHIAAEARVSKRTVYAHFDAKEALFEGVMNGLCARLAGTCPLGETWAGPPEEVLCVAGRWFLTVITRPATVALYRVVTGESLRFPRLGELFYRMGPGRMIERVARYLADQDARGTLSVPDAEAAAVRFLELVRSPVHMPLALGLRGTPGEDEIADAVDEAVRLFLCGHRPGVRSLPEVPRRRASAAPI